MARGVHRTRPERHRMSKLHPWDRYVGIASGEKFRATGTIDRRWPTTDHAVVDASGSVVERTSTRLEFQLEAGEQKLTTSAKVNFAWEASEPAPTGALANTVSASGKIGFLSFTFDDQEVEFAEKEGAIEVIADGKIDVTGPVDVHARVTMRIWQTSGKTRVRFQAVRKNGKLLGEGELTIGG
jgi:hypothetical protein